MISQLSLNQRLFRTIHVSNPLSIRIEGNQSMNFIVNLIFIASLSRSYIENIYTIIIFSGHLFHFLS